MPTNREIENFVELTVALTGAGEALSAASRFLARNGIGVLTRAKIGRPPNGHANGNGHKAGPTPALIERVRRTYTRRAPLRQTSDIELPAAGKAKGATYSTKRLQDRQFSAAILEALDRHEPRPLIPGANKSIGALVRRGYAKKKGNGLYVRTAKTFAVTDKPAKATRETMDVAPESGDTMTVAEAAKVLQMSDSNVRIIIKAGGLTAHQELRSRRGMNKLIPTMVLNRTDVAQYAQQP